MSPEHAQRRERCEASAVRDEEAAAFALDQVEAAIAGTQFAGSVHHFASTSSTNTLALEAAQSGAATGVWVADEQTAGRGRGGHTWHSTPGHGLYVSILVRPALSGPDALKLSLAAGLAAQAAIAEACGVDIDLRWPNDLMAPFEDGTQKKLGGILTESSMEGGASAALAYAVIGIGINLNHPEFPAELAPLATSLRILSGSHVSREAVLAALLRHLEQQVLLVEAEARGIAQDALLAARFERASTWVRGLPVHVDEDGGYVGTTAGLDTQGLLQIQLDGGTTRIVRHGGVRRATVNTTATLA